MWSMGVIVYIMFTGGHFPFGKCKTGVKNRDRRQIVKDVMADIDLHLPKFEHNFWSHVSEDAKVLHAHQPVPFSTSSYQLPLMVSIALAFDRNIFEHNRRESAN